MSFHLTRILIVHGCFGELLTSLLHTFVATTRRETDCLALRLYQHQADAQRYLLEGQWRTRLPV